MKLTISARTFSWAATIAVAGGCSVPPNAAPTLKSAVDVPEIPVSYESAQSYAVAVRNRPGKFGEGQ